MRRREPRLSTRLAVAAAALLFIAPIGRSLAQGQATGPLPGGGAGIYGQPITTNGGNVSFGNGPPPSLNAACGTGASAVVGTDSAFSFTSGTTTSGTCAIKPATPWNQMPNCLILSEAATKPAYSVGSDGTITLSGVADSTKYHGLCIGQPGG